MITIVIIVFIVGYLAIAFEQPLKIDKAASALLTGVLCWAIYIMSKATKEPVLEELFSHFAGIAAILFFLIGVMTTVELIDSHNGFSIITDQIKTRSLFKLIWIISIVTFFLSALLDNLTTTIVMSSLSAKLVTNKKDRLWFISMIIIAANAGGAFSPIGDVTTTMLWIGGQITAFNIIAKLFVPSLFVCLIPLVIISSRFRKQTFSPSIVSENNTNRKEGSIILITSILLLIFIPVFKMITHLPPFMGVLFSLGILWIIVSAIHFKKPHKEKQHLMLAKALQKIDSPSILFFLGILLAVAALDSSGILEQLALFLDHTIGNLYIIGSMLGLLSAVVDNVPLVAATQGMYNLTLYPADHHLWEFLALTIGTGGSAIIIGSAAGVAAMGMEKISFLWYLKKISWIALTGFFAGILIFMLQTLIF